MEFLIFITVVAVAVLVLVFDTTVECEVDEETDYPITYVKTTSDANETFRLEIQFRTIEELDEYLAENK